MNNEYLTVSALTQYIKKKFDYDPYLSKVYLTGEISNFRLRKNAHQYFSLKDDNAKISAIMFKSAFNKLKFTPEEGMKVLVVGHISVYEPTGSYQIYIERMEPDGVGQLYQAYEQLKKRLSAEGLFTKTKRPLVKFPKRIAVVTSPSGAVIRDIITTARRRYPIAQIVLFPALVQGTEASNDIVRQINRANEMGDFDTLIIGRGGGSIEDLWPFNEENVARAISTSEIPVISSVGHETDTTIADLVADVRAATPTAAAELAVPKLEQVMLDIRNNQNRLMNAVFQLIKQAKLRLQKLEESTVFKSPQRIYETYTQRVDLLTQRLIANNNQNLNHHQSEFSAVDNRLKLVAPITKIERYQQLAATYQMRLVQAQKLKLGDSRKQFQLAVSSLDHLSPLKILARGYSYTTDADDQLISKVDLINQGDNLTVHLSDGSVVATVNEIIKDKREE
ncbi:exodeoxyribonuclease VII large subunit [Lentilactobacillus curieae]|uniref:Exodeoxyribonuclease 7 large subunit n=1 Tax=Lentilactobacillus curieae TaxID=1138822 RepID=A0A1S6QK71_9LACO|nr:exodeoxyribonuclease VII large subunit [Lentilactobacillus curieae]AQW22001.1 exodeoxyribonuclease VII large subunit [Lentilactobacillus curieae]